MRSETARREMLLRTLRTVAACEGFANTVSTYYLSRWHGDLYPKATTIHDLEEALRRDLGTLRREGKVRRAPGYPAAWEALDV